MEGGIAFGHRFGPRRPEDADRWQSELSPWTRDALAGVLPYCQQQGVAFLPFSPLGRGFLTGRFSSLDDLPQDDFRRGLPRFRQDALRANLAIVGTVREVAERAGATPAQVALAWILAQGQHVVPIPGDQDPEIPGGQRRRGGHPAERGGPGRTRRPAHAGGRPLLTCRRFASSARQIDLICAAQSMSIEAALAAPNGGSTCTLQPRIGHAP